MNTWNELQVSEDGEHWTTVQPTPRFFRIGATSLGDGSHTIRSTELNPRRYEAKGNSITLVEDGYRYGQFRVDLTGATDRLTRRIADALNEYDRTHPLPAQSAPEKT